MVPNQERNKVDTKSILCRAICSTTLVNKAECDRLTENWGMLKLVFEMVLYLRCNRSNFRGHGDKIPLLGNSNNGRIAENIHRDRQYNCIENAQPKNATCL